MPLQTGTVAFLKTTDEPCFVLEVKTYKGGDGVSESDASCLSGDFASVRRPVATNDGTQHITELFHVEELETLEDRKARAEAEAAEFRKRMSKQSPETQEDFHIN